MSNHISIEEKCVKPGIFRGQYVPMIIVPYISKITMIERTLTQPFFLYTKYPTTIAMGISAQTGKTD